MAEPKMVAGWREPIARRGLFDRGVSCCMNVTEDDSRMTVNVATSCPAWTNRDVSLVLDRAAREEIHIHLEVGERRSRGQARSAAYGLESERRRVLSLYA